MIRTDRLTPTSTRCPLWLQLGGDFLILLASCGGSSPGRNTVVSQVGGPPETSAAYPGALLFPRSYPKPDVTLEDAAREPSARDPDQGRVDTGVLRLHTLSRPVSPEHGHRRRYPPDDPLARTSRVKVVFVTTDPNRDTPSVIRIWLDHFDPSFIGLTGTISQIQQTEATTGIPLSFAEHATEAGASYTVVHAGYILVYTQDNRAHVEFPAEILPSQEAQDIATLLRHRWQA